METAKTEISKDSKAWLQKLKEESWEAELLISTVAIFGTVQMFKLVDWSIIYFVDTLAPQDYLFGFCICFISLIAVSVLATMFVIHFMLRAYWVGLVGLNSVFPDYNLEESPYSKIYTKKMLAILPKLKETIQEVDDICSVIFSSAFSVFTIYGYMTLLGVIFFKIYSWTKDYIPREIWIGLVALVVVFSFFYMVMMVVGTHKKYKENEKVQNLFFSLVKWSNQILMGPLYRYMLQVTMIFGTNFKKKKSIGWLMLTFIGVGFLVTLIQLDNTKISYFINKKIFYGDSKLYSNYYANTANKESFLIAPQLESDVVERNVVKVFIPVYDYEDNIAEKQYGEYVKEGNLERDAEREKRRKWYLDRRVSYHEIQLNDKDIEVDFLGYNMPETGQYGLLGYINLQGGMGQEKNILRITKKLEDNESAWTIPFRYIEN